LGHVVAIFVGVATGLTGADGATATATGTTFQAVPSESMRTVAVSVEEGGPFTADGTRLAGADGAGCERAALLFARRQPTRLFCI
jgi:hypothetical protein